MGTFKSYKEESRKNWGKTTLTEDEKLSSEEIQLGAILRIADTSELMAKNYLQLQKEFDQMKRSKEYFKDYYEEAKRSIAAYKGQITKLKKQLKNGKS